MNKRPNTKYQGRQIRPIIIDPIEAQKREDQELVHDFLVGYCKISRLSGGSVSSVRKKNEEAYS